MRTYLLYYELEGEKIYKLIYAYNLLDAKNRLQEYLDINKFTCGLEVYNATIWQNE